jgi:hypothetical protein
LAKYESWKITCEGSLSDRNLLKSFHDSMAGDFGTFYFFNPDDQIVNVRFIDGKLPIIDKRELDTTKPSFGAIVGFSAELTIEKVI